jgi:hypothetical protein
MLKINLLHAQGEKTSSGIQGVPGLVFCLFALIDTTIFLGYFYAKNRETW